MEIKRKCCNSELSNLGLYDKKYTKYYCLICGTDYFFRNTNFLENEEFIEENFYFKIPKDIKDIIEN